MYFCAGLAGRIEREMISQRTKSALLARKKAGGEGRASCGEGETGRPGSRDQEVSRLEAQQDFHSQAHGVFEGDARKMDSIS